MLKDAKMIYPERFLEYINNKEGVKLPKKTRDVYIYLPHRMMGIIPTIDLFSNLNLSTGKQFQRAIFYRASPVSNNGGVMRLSNGMEIRGGVISVGRKSLPINQIITTAYDSKGVLQKSRQIMNIGSDIYVIFMQNYNQFLILDKRMFYSLYVQLFVLENYDTDLYEPVILDPFTKIYRLKI
jgi:dolichyl-diphosphooligosaccharide--protein glycosyltransferase/undecaprenyl-diphosphooligosaccharide--protein glycosyltransferase